MTSKERKYKLQALVDEYHRFKKEGKLDLTSEETIRTWLNQLLGIFGWDVRDTSQILQEKALSASEKKRLKNIDSTNTRPDYTFKVAKQKLTFLDAKDLSINLETDKKAAFQIKSYGWSIAAPCAFISNFEQFVIYDCTYLPTKDQDANFGRLLLSIDEYIAHFEILENHLLKDNTYKGKLNELYGNKSLKGVQQVSPDFAFAALLSNFRLVLAKEIYQRNSLLIRDNSEILSYVVQVIINRVLFIRVCEARKLEERELLLRFRKEGFWQKFKASSYFGFYEHYDGPLFDRIEILQNLQISDKVFDRLLKYLYYPSPYRFDVIPAKLLSDIYEIFLSRKIQIEGGEVKDALKSEYSKTKGAISTPQYIVADIIRRTLKKNTFFSRGISHLLETKVLDIACGSGVFVIEVYDYLEELLKELYQAKPDKRYAHLFVRNKQELMLNVLGKKAILDNCIYGIDIDSEAVEVAKMSLALKVIDNADYPQMSEPIGLLGSKILEGIGNNIQCGNSLVDSSILEQYPSLLENEEELMKTNPFDWDSQEGFGAIFETKGGFDYIIGNPPYVEVKNYNEELPYMHHFIKRNFLSSKNGKIDLAIPFIERGISLLNKTGRLGFIVQKRFFKTNYGKKIREIISDKCLISSIVDFETTKIFKSRITYVSILILDNTSPETFYYKLFPQPTTALAAELRVTKIPEIDANGYYALPAASLSKAPWGFDDPYLISLRTKLAELGTLGEVAKVKVGIQALWDTAYHIEVIDIQNGILTGKSHLEDSFTIEVAACRPLICNKRFYTYRSDKTDTYVIFPYQIINGVASKILFNDFTQKFPLAAAYLNRNKAKIQSNVETLSTKFPDKYSDEYWHLFTREQNHSATYPKIPIPMTALDTFAMITHSSNHYCDNANVNFLALENPSKINLYAFSAVINSSIFSVLARSIANPQTNGYFKFNKQFLEPIPFPIEAFSSNEQLQSELAQIVQSIEQKQESYLLSAFLQKKIMGRILQNLWKQLDKKVAELYGLTAKEMQFFEQRGRNVNRVEFLNS
ncbi:MAG: N-6 DNA methylase [Chitinophagales bacterium]